MKAGEARIGRLFVIRFDDGDRLPGSLESFARKKGILRAACFLVGGIKSGSRIVTGPKKVLPRSLIPILRTLSGHHEILAVGMIFPDEKGDPKLHMHAALGRKGATRTGCIRPGVEIWKLGEMVLLEISGSRAVRKADRSGVALLHP